MATGKAWWQCFMPDENEQINTLQDQLNDTRDKLEQARKEIRRLKFENVTLINKQHSTLSDKSSDFPHVTRPIPNYDYSTKTMIVHAEHASKQTSALEQLQENVIEKLQKRNTNEYETLSDTDHDEYDGPQSEEERHREKVRELMKQIDRLRNIIQQNEEETTSKMHENGQYIASLERQIYEFKLNQSTTTPLSLKSSQNTSFSVSMSKIINDTINADDDAMSQKSCSNRSISSQTSASNSRPNRKSSSLRATRYDNTKEQIDILNNNKFKQKSLILCREQFVISKAGKDKGLILFFQKYLKTKTLDQIFKKSGLASKSDTDQIANATTLVNVLSFAVILYKVKVFQTEKPNQKPQINNTEVKNSVKYLAIWLVRSYGEKTRNKYYHNKIQQEYDIYNFKMTKDAFVRNMPRYIEQFVKKEGAHMDSDI